MAEHQQQQQQQPEDSYLRTGDTTIDFAEALSNVKKLSTQSFSGGEVGNVKVDVVKSKFSLHESASIFIF